MCGRGLDGVSQASLRRGLEADDGLKEKPPPLHGTWAVMKLSSPQHAQNRLFSPISDEWGRFFFHVALVGTFSCSAGAIFLSLRSLDASCCETGSASTGFPRPVEETDDTFAGGGWLGETNNPFVSGTCPVSAVCERSVGHWRQMVWMAGVVGLRDDASSRRSARRPHWRGGTAGTGGLDVAPVGGGRMATGHTHSPTSGTKLTQQTSSHRTRGIKFALLAQNGPFWHVFRMHGELCTVFAANEPHRANFIPHARQRWG